jgi:predicted PurR-regulated permease PerM
MPTLDDKLDVLMVKLKKKWKIISIVSFCCAILIGSGFVIYNHIDGFTSNKVITSTQSIKKDAKINLQIELNNSTQAVSKNSTGTKKYCIDALIGLITSIIGYIIKKLIDIIFESKRNRLINVFRDMADEDSID